jgi:hypothetical protein
MNILNITRYEIPAHNEADDFVEALHSVEFRYTTRQLVVAGVQPEEIIHSINKAIKVCRLNFVDPADHFRSFYVFDELKGNLYCDWRMTREGFMLAIMNTPATNTSIAHWQWELAKSSRR